MVAEPSFFSFAHPLLHQDDGGTVGRGHKSGARAAGSGARTLGGRICLGGQWQVQWRPAAAVVGARAGAGGGALFCASLSPHGLGCCGGDHPGMLRRRPNLF